MLYEERYITFKNAVGQAFINLTKGTSPSTKLQAYDIVPSILAPLNKCKKDPQLSTIFRIAEAYEIEPEEVITRIKKELPEGFTFSDV